MKTQFISLCAALLLLAAACSKDNAGAAKDQGTGKGASMARFAIAGNYMYVVNSMKLMVYDISNTSTPVYKSEVDLGWRIETIFPYDNNLFIGAATGMYICSLNDPANPKLEARVQHLRACDPVVTTGATAYVTLRAGVSCGGSVNVLQVYNVGNITSPVLLRTLELNGPYGLGTEQNALYVCDGRSGLSVYDITDPAKPVPAKIIPGDAQTDFRDVIPYGNVLIAQLANGVSFYDISQPKQPQYLSTLRN